MSRGRTKSLTMEQFREMMKNLSNDDDDIDTSGVLIVRPEPIYHVYEEEGND